MSKNFWYDSNLFTYNYNLHVEIWLGYYVVACVLTKVGKPNQGSGKHKGASRDFRKKTRLKQWENQIATNRRSVGIHFVSFETQKHLFSILILGWGVVGWKVVCTYFIVVVIERVVCPFIYSRHCLLVYFWGNHKSRRFC